MNPFDCDHCPINIRTISKLNPNITNNFNIFNSTKTSCSSCQSAYYLTTNHLIYLYFIISKFQVTINYDINFFQILTNSVPIVSLNIIPNLNTNCQEKIFTYVNFQ